MSMGQGVWPAQSKDAKRQHPKTKRELRLNRKTQKGEKEVLLCFRMQFLRRAT